MDKISLTNFIKYCLGYIKLTRQSSFLHQTKSGVKLPEYCFDLKELLESDPNENTENIGKLINLNTFYSFEPKNIPEEVRRRYDEEKTIANKIDEIYNKGKNDPYTKQIVFSFGYYEIEVPPEEETELRADYSEEEEGSKKVEKETNRFPLFSLPVSIEKVFEKGAGKYFIKPIDTEIQVNINILADILGEDRYYELIEKFGKYELKGDLSLPIKNIEIFEEIWNEIKAQLKLTNAKFDEKSFSLNEIHIEIRPRANYFIAEDLQKLSKYKEEDFKNTSLISWIKDENLSLRDEIPEEGELYFPFPYDEYQLRVLSIINNTASIIQGPPGTGKSQTIANLLCHLVAKRKKVLFVSQKQQALKVVKDMLKKLGVKYLFAYLPDIGSTQLNESDRLDGIALQLAALGSYIDELDYKTYSKKTTKIKESEITEESIKNVAEKKAVLKQSFNESIKSQREIYKLYNELNILKNYEVEIENINQFSKGFSEDVRNKIITLKNDIERLEKEVKSYENNENKSKLNYFLIFL